MNRSTYGPLSVVGGKLPPPVAGGVGMGDGMDHQAVLDAFGAHQRARGLAERTIERRYYSLRKFARFAEPVPLLNVTPELIEDWLNVHRNGETKACYLGDLRALFKWARRRRLCEEDPTEDVDPVRRPKGLPRPILEDELALALASADARLRVVLLLGSLGGLRRFEIAPLRTEDCTERSVIVRCGKGGRARVQPTHPALWAAIRTYDPPWGWLFPSPVRAGHITAGTVAAWVTRHFGALGIHRTLHATRHFYGTHLAEVANGNLLAVQDLMGHESVTTTQRYVKFNQSGRAELVNQLRAG